MSDNELDELLLQLKDTCRKNRPSSSNETNLNNVLKKIDVFINRRQMKLLNHQKRLDDLQRDLLLSECESSRNRAALEKKDFEVNQLHQMLNKAEHTTQNIMTKYDNEVQKLAEQLCNVQQEYERLRMVHKTNQDNSSSKERLTEIARLQDFNKMLEIDNQRLYTENDQLKQELNHRDATLREKNARLGKLTNSFQCSNQQQQQSSANQTVFESKIKTLEQDIDLYKTRSNEQSMEIDKLRGLLNTNEQQCNLLRLELQRVQTEKEFIRIHLIEQKLLGSPTSELPELEQIDYEKFIRHELEINMDQANKLINYWKCHKQSLEEKIRQLTKENQANHVHDLSKQIYQCNENILHAKREMNTLQMEITDKNTIIYNLYKKIECLEQALNISKQRMTAQFDEIQELRSRHPMVTPLINKAIKKISVFIDGLSTDDEGQVRQSIDLNRNLCTSSPIKSADIQKYFRNIHNDSSLSIGILHHNNG